MNMKQSLFLLSILFLVVSCSGDRSKGSVKRLSQESYPEK